MAEYSLLVYSTFPDLETGRRVARQLVEEKLAACVNLLPQVESTYRWQGQIETAIEVMATIKTTTWRYQALESRLLELHPYELPEIVSVKIENGHTPYLDWIEQSISG